MKPSDPVVIEILRKRAKAPAFGKKPMSEVNRVLYVFRKSDFRITCGVVASYLLPPGSIPASPLSTSP